MKKFLVVVATVALASPAFAGDRRERALERWDTNGDGEISQQERDAAKAEVEEKRAAVLEQYDENGDGKLDREERQAAREAGDLPDREGRGRRGGGRHR